MKIILLLLTLILSSNFSMAADGKLPVSDEEYADVITSFEAQKCLNSMSSKVISYQFFSVFKEITANEDEEFKYSLPMTVFIKTESLTGYYEAVLEVIKLKHEQPIKPLTPYIKYTCQIVAVDGETLNKDLLN